jgi:hypothetical protein
MPHPLFVSVGGAHIATGIVGVLVYPIAEVERAGMLWAGFVGHTTYHLLSLRAQERDWPASATRARPRHR